MDAKTDWITYLNLTAHPESGYFSENYRSSMEITFNETHAGKRNLATSIYYMLEYEQVSKLHQLKSDEIWYFHYGSPLKVHVFNDGSYKSYTLGTDVKEKQLLQLIIPARAIFGAEVMEKDSFSILGCMVTPGFHFTDFKLVTQNEILPNFPDQKNIIQKLT